MITPDHLAQAQRRISDRELERMRREYAGTNGRHQSDWWLVAIAVVLLLAMPFIVGCGGGDPDDTPSWCATAADCERFK